VPMWANWVLKPGGRSGDKAQWYSNVYHTRGLEFDPSI
jgi:hypothetical protein